MMKFKIEGISVPLIETETHGGAIDYIEEEARIRIKGYKNRDKIKFVETSTIIIHLSGLPKELQGLWEDFKVKVEDWVREQELVEKIDG